MNNEYFLAVPPFKKEGWMVVDSLGHPVITCNDDNPPCTLYSGTKIDQMDEHFTCSKCGRFGLRMDDATPEQCGLPCPTDSQAQ